MTRDQLFTTIKEKASFLCTGLDTDPQKIPRHLLREQDPVFAFNKAIIDATIDYTVAYKPNLAFYEVLGARGWESLQRTLEYIPDGIFTIADAKRGDIGNTSELYARAFFEQLNVDAVTVAPYMGSDSVRPFLTFQDKWVILLALTSNKGSADFQNLELGDGSGKLYEKVIEKTSEWAGPEQMMYVVGATRADMLKQIRQLIPDYFLLVPGVGAQGGSLEEVAMNGMNDKCGLLVNSSRGILYASSGKDFAVAAGKAARTLQEDMKKYLDLYLNSD